MAVMNCELLSGGEYLLSIINLLSLLNFLSVDPVYNVAGYGGTKADANI